jgi:hypothetical protein
VRLVMIAALAGLGVLCGCSDDSEPERQDARVPTPRCELVTDRQQVFVRLTGESAGELCGAWSTPGADGGWTRPTAAQPGGSFERVCVLYRGRTAAGLYAAGSISSVAQAKGFCGRLLDRGWDELGSPDPTLAMDYPAPSPLLPVRCAEGRCIQGDRRVSRPQSGSDCPGGRWTFALSRDQNSGVYRCR